MAQQPPRRQAPEGITALSEEVSRLRERLARMADATEAEISKVNPQLKDAAQIEEAKRIRSLFAKESAPLAARLAEIRGEIEPQAQHFTREAVRARAEFDRDPVKNATIGLYWLQRAAAASPGELVEIARHAASEYSHALALSVEREIMRRGIGSEDAGKAALELVASVPLAPQDVTTAERLKATALDAELAVIETRQTASGRSEPESRLTVGLAASAARRDRSSGTADLGAGLAEAAA